MPVVHVLTLAPLLLEGLLTLVHRHLIVEVPLAVVVHARLLRGVGCLSLVAVAHIVALGALLLKGGLHSGLLSLVALFFFFLFQGFNHAVDGFQAFLLGHVGQFL